MSEGETREPTKEKPLDRRSFIIEGGLAIAGGIENFSSAILYKLPPDLTEAEINSDESLEKITKRQIVDQELVRALKQKLTS